MGSSARSATALLLVGVAVTAAGCGSSSPGNPAQLALEREDLIFVARSLQSLRPSADREVAATRSAWPYIYRGLPTRRDGLDPYPLRAASASAQLLELPALLQERAAAALTGPASGIAGLYRAFSGLARRGWEMIAAGIGQIEHGPPRAARFARANIALYIESIYDAHFGLGQIGKQLLRGYEKLGGQPVFGSQLTRAEVVLLAGDFNEAHDLLTPHETVKLGS